MKRVNFLHKLWCIACFMFLALVCGGQVYQSVHLHHFHTGDSVAFKVSAHPVSKAVEHTSTHHHHEESSSHEDENEHKYKKNTVWWNVARSKSTVNVAFDLIGQAATNSLPFIALDVATFFPQKTSRPKERHVSFRVIRGPPNAHLNS